MSKRVTIAEDRVSMKTARDHQFLDKQLLPELILKYYDQMDGYANIMRATPRGPEPGLRAQLFRRVRLRNDEIDFSVS